MIRTLQSVAFAIAFAVVALGLQAMPASAANEMVIKERKEIMKKFVLKNFKTIKAFVKDGKGSFGEVALAAKELEKIAPKILRIFPKGTGRPDVDEKMTRALSKIWEDWAGFEKAAKSLGLHAGHVVMYASQKNKAEVDKHFGFMGKTGCGACHKSFRGKKVK